MESLIKYSLIVAGTSVVTVIISQLVLSNRIDRVIDDRIAELYEKEAKKFKVEFVLINNDYEIPTEFSDGEVFVPESPEAVKEYLETKVGFKYEFGNLEFRKNNPDAPDLGAFFDKIGQKYTFEVLKLYNNTEEMLTIFYYNGGVEADTYAHIADDGHDNIPDRISLTDFVNNTKIIIRRDKRGKLKFTGIDESGAKMIFDEFTKKYQEFKKKHNIDERIFDFEPKFELKEVGPHTTY